MISYAKAGGPPDNWQGLEIIDLDTGEALKEVVEVNSAEGWVIVNKLRDGKAFIEGDEIAKEKITGRFEIRERASHALPA